MKKIEKGRKNATDHLDTVLEYFKINRPELYEKYMDGVQCYIGKKV